MLSFLRERAIDLAFACESHVGLLRRISSLCAEVDGGLEVAQATSALMERERLGSVVVAPGNEPVVAVVRTVHPVAFDEGAVTLSVGILTPEQATSTHLELLRFWASLLRDDAARGALLRLEDPSQVVAVVGAHRC
jgi:mannitol/fructose-specific phosphotransferase system IIA component (Ntr-type)